MAKAGIKQTTFSSCSNALCPFPNFVFSVADKIEIAKFPALAKGLGTDEVGIGQVAVVDDIGVAMGCWLTGR